MVFNSDAETDNLLSESQLRQAVLRRRSRGLKLRCAIESLSRNDSDAGGLVMEPSDQLTLIHHLCADVQDAFGEYTGYLLEDCRFISDYDRQFGLIGQAAVADAAARWREIAEYVTFLPQYYIDRLPGQIEDGEVAEQAFAALRSIAADQAGRAADLLAKREEAARILTSKPKPGQLIDRWLARSESDVTNDDAAERMRISKTTYFKIKAGLNWARLSNYAVVAKVIGCNPSDLYPVGQTERPPRKKPVRQHSPKGAVTRRNKKKTRS